ncbi:MAG: hypothetical protein U0787_10865 [Polyangia bacterium]
MRWNRWSWVQVSALRYGLLVLALVLAACQGENGGGGSSTGGDGSCGCAVGATRCLDGQIQACEQKTVDCTNWGQAVSCPGGGCNGDRCNSTCQDTCSAGATRCANEGTQEVCRISASGCFDWTQISCAAGSYCSTGQCIAAIPCTVGCPAGYTCRPTGICTGGTPTGLVFDLKTVRVSGAITLNGAAPATATANCSTTQNAGYYKARVTFTETTNGYTFYADSLCKDAGYTFAQDIYPGTYKVTVQGGYYSKPYLTNLPDAPFVVNPALKVSADVSGLVYDFRTVKVDGQVTLNGAAPATTTANCSTTQNAGYYKARVTFTETTNGYTFYADSLVQRCGIHVCAGHLSGHIQSDGAGRILLEAVPDELAGRTVCCRSSAGK